MVLTKLSFLFEVLPSHFGLKIKTWRLLFHRVFVSSSLSWRTEEWRAPLPFIRDCRPDIPALCKVLLGLQFLVCSSWALCSSLCSLSVMCENKLICLFTSRSDVYIACQVLKHSESNSVSEQCQWPDTGLGRSLHANPHRSRSAERYLMVGRKEDNKNVTTASGLCRWAFSLWQSLPY